MTSLLYKRSSISIIVFGAAAFSYGNSLSNKHNRSLSMQNSFRGCILGGAIGDALGRPIENRRDDVALFYVKQLKGNVHRMI